MNSVVAPLYDKDSPAKLGRLLLSSSARKVPEGDVSISIYENCLVESSPHGKCFMPLDFDLKFGFTANPPAIFFEKETAKQSFELRSGAELQQWREVLKGRLNQRGFHEQFKPKKKIGKGNFASVYLAEKVENGRNYAVKAFSKEAAYSEDKGKECLIKEIEIMRALNHKNCMKLHEVFESDNSLYMVVELLEGGLLHDKIKAKEKFKSHEIKEIMESILSGLK
jgi:serine/threonine protein kinase